MLFFFKQKTAYEMRISGWSSDVCSSDLSDGKRQGKSLFGSIDLRFRGKGPATDVRRILRRGGGYRVSNGLVTFNEPRHALKHAQHILGHQHLAIAPRRSAHRTEEHTSELQSLMRNSYAVFCLNKKRNKKKQ